jgi:hypothetical protein
MENQTLNNLKTELIEKFVKDGIETTRTVAALVGVDKDFDNGKVAVTYLPLLAIYTTKDDRTGGAAFFVDNCDIGQASQFSLKSGVFTKEQVEQWRAMRTELFGECPKGILKAIKFGQDRPEDSAYLLAVSRAGIELNKSMRVSSSYPNK